MCIFQYVAIVQMQKMRLGQALAQAIRAGTLSLVMFEIRLFGWMGFVPFVSTNKLNRVYPFFGLLCRWVSLQAILQTGRW
jgi:hypothetical protein